MNTEKLCAGDVAVWRNRPEESSVIFSRQGRGLTFGAHHCSTRFILPIENEDDFRAIMKFVGGVYGLRLSDRSQQNKVVFEKSIWNNWCLHYGDKIKLLPDGRIQLIRDHKIVTGLAPIVQPQWTDLYNVAYMIGALSNMFFLPMHDQDKLTLSCLGNLCCEA